MTGANLNSLHAKYATSAEANSITALYDAIRQYVSQITRNHRVNDAEDVTGDVVADVWRSLANFKGHSSFATWVHHLAKSAIIDHIRQERRRPNLIGEDGEYRIAGPDHISSLYMDVHDLPALTEGERELVRQLIACPDYDELAEKLGMSNIALRSRFARIRKKCEAQRCVSVSVDD